MLKHYYPADDAIVYFTNRIEKQTNAEYSARLLKAHLNIGALIEHILMPSVELERRLDLGIPELDSESELLFGLDKSIGGEKQPLSNAAWLLLGYRAGLGETEGDLDEMVRRRHALSAKERDMLFLSYLFDLEDTEAPKLVDRAGEPGLIADTIGRSGINSLTRIKLIELYMNFDAHIDRLAKILAPAVGIIKDCEEVYESAAEKQLEALAAEKDLSAYMLKKHNFKLSESDKHILHLSILAPHTVNIRDGVFGNMDVYLGVGVNDLAQLLYAGKDSDRLANVFKLLSDETRLEMLQAISRRPMYGLELAEAFSVTAPTVSYHMTKLVMSGLAESYFEGGKSYFKANAQELLALRKNFDSFFGIGAQKPGKKGADG